MRKQAKYTYQKINQDTAKTKQSNTFYWDAKNIRVMTNEEFGAVTNQEGNEQIITLPEIATNPTTKTLNNVAFPINNLKIIHSEKIDERVILFSTNSTSEVEGVEAIWLLEEVSKDNFTINLLYLDQLGFNEDSNIESVGINENEQSQKVYWVDGVNEVRFINIVDDTVINKIPSDISVTPSATLLDPSVTGYSDGGSHQAGVVQYAYNLYNKFGAQTKVSGLSELVSLYNGDNGDELDTPVGKSPNIFIGDIPQNFEYIRVYSLFYSSLGQTPRISLIYDNENVNSNLEITDTNDIIQEVSLNEFNIIGTQSIIPKHITNKDGHLFFADYKTKKFDVDYDARVFSFNRIGVAPNYIWGNTFEDNGNYQNYTLNTSDPLAYQDFLDSIGNQPDHDAIPVIDRLEYQFGTGIRGYAGKNASITVEYKSQKLDDVADNNAEYTSLKRGEKYRVGVVFYNDKDEESFVKWMADVKIPAVNEDGYSNIISEDNARLARLRVTFNNLPEEVKSFRLVKVKRGEKDKTIKAQGFLSNHLLNYEIDIEDEGTAKVKSIYSNYLTRTLGGNELTEPFQYQFYNILQDGSTLRGDKFNNIAPINDTNTLNREINALDEVSDVSFYDLSERDFSLKSAEIKQSKNNISRTVDKLRIIGLAEASETFSKVDFYTSYSFTQVYGTQNKDTGGFNISIDEDVEARKSFQNTNIRDELFTFQVDSLNADSGSQPWNLRDLFFNLENNPDDNQSFRLITPRRSTFTFTKEDSSTIEVNDWEFKKIIYNRKFNNFTPLTGNNVADFLENGYVIKTNDTNEDLLISNFSFLEQATGSPEIVKTPTVFKNYSELSNFKSDFYTISNTQIIFNSDTLYDLIDGLESEVTKSALVIAEIVSDNTTQYGGNTYNDRQRNTYIPLSKKVQKKGTNQLLSCYGDTYIQKQSYLSNNYSNTPSTNLEGTLAEVITYIGESSINHSMRYDNIQNKNTTDNTEFEDAFKYNKVYQQESDLIKSLTKPFNFTEQEVFRSEIVASPKKQLGEFIDNWTTISINDRITLDTKYGEVTAFAKLSDVLYAFQRNAVAYLAVNPRVQVQANDNIPIQLGTGRLIERYQYISTESGTLHPRSVEETEGGIFYFDTLNYSINRLTNKKEEISLTKGLYNFVRDFTTENYDNLFPANKVTTYYDNLSEEVFFTFNIDNGFTVAYNLLADGFVSFYDFIPNVYFTINNNMFSIPSDDTVWEHNKGPYNTFYGVYYPSSITLLFNEDPDYEKIVDNLSFITNVLEDEEDRTNITFNKIQVNNAYQDTSEVDLEIGKNIRRKFREFHITLPREQGTRNRIRSEYALIKLTFDYPANNYELVLNDSIVSYTIN